MNTVVGETLHGPAGTAVEHTFTFEPGEHTAQRACLGSWLIDAPGQSPAWRHYLLSVVHLRPVDGVPATIVVPHATHEIVVTALDPDRAPSVGDTDSWLMLVPVNVAEQVELPDDAAAVRLLRACAQAVVDGVLPAEPPLAGAVEPWRTSLLRTAAHERGEPHAP